MEREGCRLSEAAASRSVKVKMDIHEDPLVSQEEKVTRFGCGAVFGLFFGFFLVLKFSLASLGIAAVTIVGAIGICGFLALRYGDEFWYAIFGRGE